MGCVSNWLAWLPFQCYVLGFWYAPEESFLPQQCCSICHSVLVCTSQCPGMYNVVNFPSICLSSFVHPSFTILIPYWSFHTRQRGLVRKSVLSSGVVYVFDFSGKELLQHGWCRLQVESMLLQCTFAFQVLQYSSSSNTTNQKRRLWAQNVGHFLRMMK
jgi:hypothetical protein